MSSRPSTFGRDRVRAGTEGFGEADELVGGLALVALEEEEAAGLRGRGLLREDEGHRLSGLVAGEVAAGAGALADLAEEEAHAFEGFGIGGGVHPDVAQATGDIREAGITDTCTLGLGALVDCHGTYRLPVGQDEYAP